MNSDLSMVQENTCKLVLFAPFARNKFGALSALDTHECEYCKLDGSNKGGPEIWSCTPDKIVLVMICRICDRPLATT
jgi:ribosomal protein L37AE/L43A